MGIIDRIEQRVAMFLLEPLAMATAPQIETSVLLSINSFSLAILGLMVTLASLYLLRQVERYRTRANDLLLNILPASIAARLKSSPETIADAYSEVTVLFADMVRGVQEIPSRQRKRMAFRVGINSGPLVAGVIGESKYQYDLWGDTVNIASRMESHGEAGKVHISDATYELLKDEFDCIGREKMAIKGKGEMGTWFLVDRKVS